MQKELIVEEKKTIIDLTVDGIVNGMDDLLRKFLERKAGGYMIVRKSIALLAEDLPRGLFMVFCDVPPYGVPLYREFDVWYTKNGSKYITKRAAWKDYAEKIARAHAARNLENYMLPEDCQLPPDRRRNHFRIRRGKIKVYEWEAEDLIQAHFGDEELQPLLKDQMCSGCYRTACRHHSRYQAPSPHESGLVQIGGGSRSPNLRIVHSR